MARRVTGRTMGGLALAGLALSLAGCGPTDAGMAATSDIFSISQAEVDAQVRAVQQQVQDAPGTPPEGLALATTQRLVRDELLDGASAEIGVVVTEAQVEAGLTELAAQYGGQEALDQAAAQAGIPSDQLDEFVRSGLQLEAIATQLGGGETAGTDALAAYSEQVGVRVAPRYGTWDPAMLQIVPGSELAVAADGGTTDATTTG